MPKWQPQNLSLNYSFWACWGEEWGFIPSCCEMLIFFLKRECFLLLKHISFPHTWPFVSHNILQRWKPTPHTLGKVRDILWTQLDKCLFFWFCLFSFSFVRAVVSKEPSRSERTAEWLNHSALFGFLVFFMLAYASFQLFYIEHVDFWVSAEFCDLWWDLLWSCIPFLLCLLVTFLWVNWSQISVSEMHLCATHDS